MDRWISLARLALLPAAALALSSCLGMGGGDAPATTATITAAAGAGELDIRRFLGPDYCPELRVRPGMEVFRRYEGGRDGDAADVVWQASIGDTVRECLYDGQGGLTLRVGVSGRVIAGPKGGPGAVSVPLRIAVVKYEEAVLASDVYNLAVTIPPQNSTVFREVREIALPSPGNDRDYILYVGFDENNENLLEPPKPVVAAVEEPVEVIEEPPPPRPAAPPSPPAAPGTPRILPTPTEGFVLPGG